MVEWWTLRQQLPMAPAEDGFPVVSFDLHPDVSLARAIGIDVRDGAYERGLLLGLPGGDLHSASNSPHRYLRQHDRLPRNRQHRQKGTRILLCLFDVQSQTYS